MSDDATIRMFVWYLRCRDRDDDATGGAYARCYVKARTPEEALVVARGWIEEDTDFLPTDDTHLVATWNEGERHEDPDERERLDEAWESEVGSIWIHTRDPFAADAEDEPD